MELTNFSITDCITNTPKIYLNFSQNPAINNSNNSNNVIIGHNSYNAVSNGYVNCTVIGNDARCTANAQVQLGSSIANIYSFGGIQNISDQRDKTDIRDITLGLDFISQLHPVDYKWNCRSDYTVPTGETEISNGIRVPIMQELPNDGSKTRTRYHHGLIAQEVKQVMDANSIDFGGYQDHSIKGGKEQLTIAYTELIAPMIKAIQELKNEVDTLKTRIAILENK
jgi:hypothetical protein